MKSFDVVVVGAGAAGLIAAGRAAELGASVLLLEKMERAGRKLLITGKGRCNITNDAPMSEFFDHIHPNPKFLKHAFSTYFSQDIIRLMNENGVDTVVERGGRVFPSSNKSLDVLNALLKWVNYGKVEIRYGQRVESLRVKEGRGEEGRGKREEGKREEGRGEEGRGKRVAGVRVTTRAGKQEIECENVILATGGKSYPATGSEGDGYRIAAALGHTIETPLQALVPVETEGDLARQLQGLSLKNVKASVWINGKKSKEDFGEMLFTHFGLTGPIILTLSRYIVEEMNKKSKVEVSIDLKPALDETKLDARLIRDLDEHGKKRMDNILRLWLPSSMVYVFLDKTGVEGWKEGHQLTSKERRKILFLMKDFRFTVTGCRPFKEAIITSGGVVTEEIDSKTMESKLVQGLYFAGEMIDLDADTGGYNLQIAFSTGYVAGNSAAKQL